MSQPKVMERVLIRALLAVLLLIGLGLLGGGALLIGEGGSPYYVLAGLAVLASFGMAWVFEAFFDGNHNDLIEAGVIVIAAGLMFTMSGWLFLRQDPAGWTSELKEKAAAAIGARTMVSMALIAFLAVLREGAETALFLHATARAANGWSARLPTIPCPIPRTLLRASSCG